MSLDKIPAGATVFVDSNVLTYYLAGDSSLASAYLPFFDRVADDELIAVTSVVVVMEVIHRVVVLEAVEKLQLERKRTVQLLTNDRDFRRIPEIEVWLPSVED
jgi:predicted nucleic acid-binding protein